MVCYLDPKNDLTFKRIFKEHPDLLISFLNAFMPFEESRFIQEINYLSAEQVSDNILKKNSFVDIKCVDNYNSLHAGISVENISTITRLAQEEVIKIIEEEKQV